MTNPRTTTTQLAVIAKDIEYIKRDVVEIKTNVKSQYVHKAEFEPIKKIVYGLVGIILSGVILAVLSFVFNA